MNSANYEHLTARLISLLDGDHLPLPTFWDLERHEQRIAIAVLDATGMTPEHWATLDNPSRGPWIERTIEVITRRQKPPSQENIVSGTGKTPTTLNQSVALFQQPEQVGNMNTRILFIGASPKDEGRLRLDEEARSIDEALRQADHGKSFTFSHTWATRVTDLQNALLRYKPHIAHFSGHGDASGELVLEDAAGHGQIVTATSLEQLFKLFKDELRGVVLNACDSHRSAKVIANHIDFVVGMSDSIDDDAAIAFSTSFYRALAYRKTIQNAFDLACNEIALRGIGGSDLPQLLMKAGIANATAINGVSADSVDVGSVQIPRYELRSARLECSPPTTNPNPGVIHQVRPEYVNTQLDWRVALSVFVEAMHGEVLTIPIHRCTGWYDDTYTRTKIQLGGLSFASGSSRIASDGVTLSIAGAGNLTIEGYFTTPFRQSGYPDETYISIRCPIIERENAELSVDARMKWLSNKNGWPITWDLTKDI